MYRAVVKLCNHGNVGLNSAFIRRKYYVSLVFFHVHHTVDEIQGDFVVAQALSRHSLVDHFDGTRLNFVSRALVSTMVARERVSVVSVHLLDKKKKNLRHTGCNQKIYKNLELLTDDFP